MRKQLLPLFILILLFAVSAYGQELTIPNFPNGVGRSIGEAFFEPYSPQLEKIADTLSVDTTAVAYVTGTADGIKYPRYNDAMNPGLALGRAQALADLMTFRFGVDSAQLVIQARTVEAEGPAYRSVSIRVQRDMRSETRIVERTQPVPAPVPETTIIKEQPVYIVDSVRVTSPDNFRLHLGAGFSTSPFGGIPFVSGAVSWNRQIYIEGIFGHTFWNSDFELNDMTLDTKDRLIAGLAVYYPFEDIPVGAVAGWVRIEEISGDYHEYTRLSEGLMVGVRALPVEFASLTALYNPSKHKDASVDISSAKNGQILLQLAVHLRLGEK